MSKEFNTALAKITKDIASNKHVIQELSQSNATVVELLNNIYARVEDMSKKFDEVLTIGLKKPKQPSKSAKSSKTSSKSDEKKTPVKKKAKPTRSKPINNIMTYFKVRFAENNDVFSDILEENQYESVCEEHKEAINAKKEGPTRERAKITLLYKSITDSQKNKVREMMINEKERATINNSDELETEL